METTEKPVWFVLLLVIVGGFAGLLMGQAIGLGLASLIYPGDILAAMLNPVDEGLRVPLLIVQATTSLGGFLIAPYFIWKALRKKGVAFFQLNMLSAGIIFLVFAIVISFVVVDSIIIEWNQNIHFPDFLKSFEEWARAKEEQLADITKMLTNFSSPTEFAIAFLVVAIFAGVCEEFFFRGIIQTEFLKGTNNIHVAIWGSAFLFSAIHAQFFGFVPRMLLGGLFGYLYFWSGNLLVPMVAHIFNNGFSLVMIYLYQLKIINTDFDSPEAAPMSLIIPSLAIAIALLYFFKKKFSPSNTSIS